MLLRKYLSRICKILITKCKVFLIDLLDKMGNWEVWAGHEKLKLLAEDERTEEKVRQGFEERKESTVLHREKEQWGQRTEASQRNDVKSKTAF